jgi:dephospho-CoA kinase
MHIIYLMFLNSLNTQHIMSNLFRVIGVCGRRRSGKDTVASILHELHGYENVKISNDLKTALKILFGFNHEQIEEHLKDVVDERWGVSPRQAMQFIGTEVMQFKIAELLPDIGRKFWINGFINKHIVGKDTNKLLVITDIRFLHEYEELRKHLSDEFLMVKVERELPSSQADNHSSEQEFLQIPVNYTIVNNGTKEDLKLSISRLCDSWHT